MQDHSPDVENDSAAYGPLAAYGKPPPSGTLSQMLARTMALGLSSERLHAAGDVEMASRASGERMLGLLKAATVTPLDAREAVERMSRFGRHGSTEPLVAAMLAAAMCVDEEALGIAPLTFQAGSLRYHFGLPFGYTAMELIRMLKLLDEDIARLCRRGAERQSVQAAGLLEDVVLCLAATPARSMDECSEKLRAMARHRPVDQCGPRLDAMLDIIVSLECLRWALTFDRFVTKAGLRCRIRVRIGMLVERWEVKKGDAMEMDALAAIRWHGEARARLGRRSPSP